MTFVNSPDPSDAYILEIYDLINETWITAQDVEFENDKCIWIQATEARDLFEGHIHLARIHQTILEKPKGTVEEKTISFFTRLEHVNSRQRLSYPQLLMETEPQHNESRRRDFRVDFPNEKEFGVEIRLDTMVPDEPSLKAQLSNLSAGGLGLILDDTTLQKIHLINRIKVKLNLILDDHKENLTLICEPRNAHPKNNKCMYIGYQFIHENRDPADIKKDTSRLLHFVAARQRNLLKQRIKVDKDKRL